MVHARMHASRSSRPFFCMWQIGVGIKGGLEAAIQMFTVRALAFMKSPSCRICWTCSTHLMTATVQFSRSRKERFSGSLSIRTVVLHMCSSRGTKRFGSERILSASGVQERDPLGPLFFLSCPSSAA